MFEQNLALRLAARARTRAVVDELTQEQLDFKPAPNKWSVGEAVHHLLLFDEFLQRDCQQLIDLARSGRRPVVRHNFVDFNGTLPGVPRSLLPWFEIPVTLAGMFVPRCARELVIRSRLVPARHPTFSDPTFGRPAAQVREELRTSVEQLESLLRANADLDFNRLRVTHPFLGDNSVVDLLRLFAAHEQRHQEQIAELLAAQRNTTAGAAS